MRKIWVIESEGLPMPMYIGLKKHGSIPIFIWVQAIDDALQFSRKEDAEAIEYLMEKRNDPGVSTHIRGATEHIIYNQGEVEELPAPHSLSPTRIRLLGVTAEELYER